MLNENYDVRVDENVETFEFDSLGPKGTFKKIVRYTEINLRGVYNLGFGDKDERTGFVSDISITNNQDSDKVLATVAKTLYAFIETHPSATVVATGSSEARTRLYRIGISNHLKEIEEDFIILGLSNQHWEPFRKDIKYEAFLVRKKL